MVGIGVEYHGLTRGVEVRASHAELGQAAPHGNDILTGMFQTMYHRNTFALGRQRKGANRMAF